jgi:CRISPR-associated protein Cas5d
VIDSIRVLKPVRFESIRRNEVGHKLSAVKVRKAINAGQTDGVVAFADDPQMRQQRAATVLRDVGYVIRAHFELTERAGSEDNEGKHRDIFTRRARRGQCFHMPCLGVREFPASFALLGENDDDPKTDSALDGERDLGWMLHDIDFANEATPKFFRARMVDGLIDVPPFDGREVRA